MQKKGSLSHYLYDFWKLLGVILVVFLALTIKVNYIGETDEVSQFDYLSLFWDDEGDEWREDATQEGDEHGISIWFIELCEEYRILCTKTTFNGEFSTREKADYFEQVSSIISQIDTTARRGEYLETVFTTILLNQAKGSRRGSSGRTNLTMNLGGLKYSDEFRQVFTHEVGHIMDLGALQGKSRTKNNSFTEFGKTVFAIDDPSIEYYKYSRQSETIRKTWVKKLDFCSGYGMTDPFEDFAECHNLYLNHNNVFQLLARSNIPLRNKYNYFANLYGGSYFSDSSLVTRGLTNSRRAWDTTRIQE